MNLKPLVDRRVFVQFRGPFFMVVASAEGYPAPATAADKDGKTGMLPMPFMQGKFVERDGNIWFQYADTDSGRKIEVLFHPDAYFSVSVVNEDRIVAP